MLRKASVAAALVAALIAGTASGSSSHTTKTASACGASCRAAYDAIAKALPRDRENVLLSALLRTPGVDWRILATSLHVPTARQIHRRWLRECERRFPGEPATVEACYLLIFGP